MIGKQCENFNIYYNNIVIEKRRKSRFKLLNFDSKRGIIGTMEYSRRIESYESSDLCKIFVRQPARGEHGEAD